MVLKGEKKFLKKFEPILEKGREKDFNFNKYFIRRDTTGNLILLVQKNKFDPNLN